MDICTPVANNCGNRGSQLEDVDAFFHFQNPTPVHEATLLDAATDLKGLYLPCMRFWEFSKRKRKVELNICPKSLGVGTPTKSAFLSQGPLHKNFTFSVFRDWSLRTALVVPRPAIYYLGSGVINTIYRMGRPRAMGLVRWRSYGDAVNQNRCLCQPLPRPGGKKWWQECHMVALSALIISSD